MKTMNIQLIGRSEVLLQHQQHVQAVPGRVLLDPVRRLRLDQQQRRGLGVLQARQATHALRRQAATQDACALAPSID